MASEALQSGTLSFTDIRLKDQKIKLRKRQVTETNWRCDIEDAIPAALKPRITVVKGAKEKVGTNAPAAPWWQWSVEVLTKLEALSSMTAGKLVFAQELMALEVKRRHRNMMSSNRDAVELLRSEEVDEDGGENESDGGDDEKDDGLIDEGGSADTISETRSTQIKAEPTDINFDTTMDSETNPTTSEGCTVTAIGTPRPRAKNGSHLKTKAEIASLRGNAMRLRQEASKMEAEAFELEVRMLRAEAKRQRLTEG